MNIEWHPLMPGIAQQAATKNKSKGFQHGFNEGYGWGREDGYSSGYLKGSLDAMEKMTATRPKAKAKPRKKVKASV